MFASAAVGFACAIRLLLDAAARRFDAGPRAGADFHAAHDDGARKLAVAKDLRRTFAKLDQAGFRQRLTRHFRALVEQFQVAERHDLRFDAERVGEAALWNPARDLHLPALEPRLAAARSAVTRPRHRALVSLAGRLALAGAGSATQPLAIAMRSRRWGEVMQSDLLVGSHVHHSFPDLSVSGVTVTRCRTLLTCPRRAAESLCTTEAWWCRRPSDLSTRRMRHECPMPLRT